jgi:caa(3)-type oxidase subunit IV
MDVTQPTEPVSLQKYLATYVALLVLATLSWLSVGLSGSLALGIALTIGAIKAVLVLTFFMHLVEERFSLRLVMTIAAILVAIWIALTLIDPLTRGPYPPAPSHNPSYRHVNRSDAPRYP